MCDIRGCLQRAVPASGQDSVGGSHVAQVRVHVHGAHRMQTLRHLTKAMESQTCMASSVGSEVHRALLENIGHVGVGDSASQVATNEDIRGSRVSLEERARRLTSAPTIPLVYATPFT